MAISRTFDALMCIFLAIFSRGRRESCVYYAPFLNIIFHLSFLLIQIEEIIPTFVLEKNTFKVIDMIIILMILVNTLGLSLHYYHAIWMTFLCNMSSLLISNSSKNSNNNFDLNSPLAVLMRLLALSFAVIFHLYKTGLQNTLLQLKAYLINKQSQQLNNMFNSHSDGIFICSSL